MIAEKGPLTCRILVNRVMLRTCRFLPAADMMVVNHFYFQTLAERGNSFSIILSISQVLQVKLCLQEMVLKAGFCGIHNVPEKIPYLGLNFKTVGYL